MTGYIQSQNTWTGRKKMTQLHFHFHTLLNLSAWDTTIQEKMLILVSNPVMELLQ